MHILEINIQGYIRRKKKLTDYITEYDLKHKTQYFMHIRRINNRARYTTDFKLQKQINFEVFEEYKKIGEIF